MNHFFTDFTTQFHFLRPLWLLLIVPCIVLFIWAWQQRIQKGHWHQVIVPELLQHLLPKTMQGQQPARWPLIITLFGWLIGTLALAGPSWQKTPTPVLKNQYPLVIAVNLSYSGFTPDLAPNRFSRMQFKLQDLFGLRKDGESALIAYAGSAHVVAPLTDDSRTLSNLAKALSPNIMPEPGDNPVAAIEKSIELIRQAGQKQGDILLITDNVPPAQAKKITQLLSGSGIKLSVLGLGTEQGAPIPLSQGGFLKDSQGNIVVPQLKPEALKQLAHDNGGQYQTITLSNADLTQLIPDISLANQSQQLADQLNSREVVQWADAGYLLVWLLLPLSLVAFRRGWLMLLLVGLMPFSQHSQAAWNDLWQTQDQQAQQALQQGDAATASTLFEDRQWRAQALYQNQQFEEAAALLEGIDTAEANYNLGNALAKAGKLEAALEAYDQALALQAEMADATFNRDVVEQLLKQQQKDQQQNSQQNQSQQDQQSQQQNSQQNQSQQDQQNQQQNSQQNQSQQDQQNQQQNSQQNQSQQDQQQAEKETPATDAEASKDNKPADKKKAEQAQAQQEAQKDESEKSGAKAGSVQSEQPQTPEQQAIDSWLRTIPDDPGGLLRRKFLYQQQLKQPHRRQVSQW